jgi:DeoR/GlpR family transcriptional regulator of sugar metabolism
MVPERARQLIRRFEPIQRERMILPYVQAHGRITRREAAELCQISSPQARNLLAKLTEKGLLLRQGRRRGIFYVLASTIVDASKTEMDKSTKSVPHPKNGDRP